MAKVVMGSFITDITGAVGGTVYQHSRFGNIARNKVVPVDVHSDYQERVRGDIADMSRHWAALTDAQRQMWTDLAEKYPQESRGKTIRLSGFLFFSKLNRNLQEIGQPMIMATPEIVEPMVITDFSVDVIATPGTEDMDLYIEPVIPADNKVIVYATSFVKKGERYVSTDSYRKIGVLDSTFVSGGSIKDMYIARFGGLLKAGQKVKFKVKAVLIASGYANLPKTTTSFATI